MIHNPEFAWELPHEAGKQSAYQILVASSKEFIIADTGDVWDSGKISSDKSIDVTFNGEPLKAGETYFWKVKIWEENNLETPYSKFQSFKMGQQEKSITSANSIQLDKIAPVNFKQTSTNSYFIDFGKDAFANMEFDYKTNVERYFDCAYR